MFRTYLKTLKGNTCKKSGLFRKISVKFCKYFRSFFPFSSLLLLTFCNVAQICFVHISLLMFAMKLQKLSKERNQNRKSFILWKRQRVQKGIYASRKHTVDVWYWFRISGKRKGIKEKKLVSFRMRKPRCIHRTYHKWKE